MLLSVTLATHNESANLDRCLQAISKIADEIVIADGQSTDDTLKIAKKFRARIIQTTNKANFHINKKLANDSAHGQWLLQLDADEVVTPQLASEILKTIKKNPDIAGYWIPRKNYFLGRFLKKGGQYPDYTLRLYRNGKGNLPAVHVHEQAVVNGPVSHLKQDLLHFGTPDFSSYLLRFNRYTSLIATQLRESRLKINFFSSINYLLIKPFSEFFSIYIRHKGFVDGYPGFVFASFSGLRFAVAYIKYWQATYHS